MKSGRNEKVKKAAENSNIWKADLGLDNLFPVIVDLEKTMDLEHEFVLTDETKLSEVDDDVEEEVEIVFEKIYEIVSCFKKICLDFT